MIPITIRILGQQTQRPLLNAASYASGIILTYSSLGLVAAFTGSLFGQFMASPLVNFVLALIMFAFAVTMLGMGNLSFLQNVGGQIGVNQKVFLVLFLMGTGAGLIASPCTGPILAGLLTYIVTLNNKLMSFSLVFTYSVGFALPYFLLGNAAATVSQFKVSGNTQSSIKLAFAAILFALSFYYLRIPFIKAFENYKNSGQLLLLLLYLELLSFYLVYI